MCICIFVWIFFLFFLLHTKVCGHLNIILFNNSLQKQIHAPFPILVSGFPQDFEPCYRDFLSFSKKRGLKLMLGDKAWLAVDISIHPEGGGGQGFEQAIHFLPTQTQNISSLTWLCTRSCHIDRKGPSQNCCFKIGRAIFNIYTGGISVQY